MFAVIILVVILIGMVWGLAWAIRRSFADPDGTTKTTTEYTQRREMLPDPLTGRYHCPTCRQHGRSSSYEHAGDLLVHEITEH